MRFLEYDKTTGRIICELISQTKPEATGNFDFLEIMNDDEIDTSLYAVKDGTIVKLYETTEERLERERLRKERLEANRARLKSMCYEVTLAFLDDNQDEINKLRKEFKQIKGLL